MDLTFDVSNQIVSRTDSNKTVNFSEGYLKLVFTFKTTDWNGLDKYVYFKADDGDYRFELENNQLVVPSVVLTGNRVTFGLFGETENVVRITTNLVIIRLVDSHFTDGGVAILDKIDELYAIKVDYADIVDNVTSTDSDKPLSANQGKVLKTLVDSNMDTVTEVLDTKANITDVNTGLALKVDKADITDNLTTNNASKVLSAKQGKVLKDTVDTKADTSYVNAELDTKSDKGHKHLKSDITDFAHNHDERYYTESEMDTKLSSKSNVGHTHDDRYYTETEADNLLNGKVDKVNGKELSTNDYTTNEKEKLAGIETEANKTIVDTTASSTSTNPLQNKVIYALLANKVDKITGKGLSANDFTNAYKGILDTFSGDWSEVIDDNLDTIIAGVIDAVTVAVLNRVVFEASKTVLQSGDTSVFKAYCIKNGLPVYNQEVSFYEVFDPVVIIGATPSVIQTGDVSVLQARVRDSNDGSLVIGQEVNFYHTFTPNIRLTASSEIIQPGDEITLKVGLVDADDGSRICEENVEVCFYKIVEE